MKQRRYSNFLDQDEEFAQFQYHSLISKNNSQNYQSKNNRISEFLQKNHNDRNQQVNKINTNNNNIEKAKSLKDLKRQNQLYQIGLKFKKITKENFILNQKLVEFKDIFGQCCTCLIGNEVEYPQFQNNEVYYLSGVQIKESLKQNKDFQIMIQKGKITQYPPDEQVQQTKPIEQEQKDNNLEINSSTQNYSIINQFQQIEFPSQNSTIKTYFNILAIVIQQFDKKQIWSQQKGRFFDFIKVEVMDQDGQLDSITLWNTFLEHKFTPYQIVFFQNIELKTTPGSQYLQTIDGISKITTDDSQLQFLHNFYEVKATMTRHLEVIKFKKLISYREILQQNPN
ncbi:unnamed protein product (macronuclear) [Paramecium tetraurelia]|uniref:Uncharacterized protein n=1 Tax=Paramecium tetraurelia TaxID=5888 RepID=A0C9M8_PARTE|nr:uncharacterized protein GSPATT00006801001 [Paramecium tetraurelia]CAK67495.1 unnamed protein product [Paramecium tetraurelia]|eukprot:XP_001434892.1 hypothetical protein (macronuclear) [Paramecium tetraurelia strain d4-2]